ncbi:MAG: universal stress protein [Hyphomicrobiales bacterium]|nr:universal stress protein [Hyphomicrobiales bacterium]MBV8662601.1 universal stress protein [Hyphomicrobiales bacterium]
MFEHILIPTDGSDLSRKAVLYGVQLAKSVGARVTALTIIEPYRLPMMEGALAAETLEDYDAEAEQSAARALEQVKMAADAASVPAEVLRERADQPYRAIIDCALANRCDLIVMASHGRRGVAALLIGSETTKVLTHSTIPVLVYR